MLQEIAKRMGGRLVQGRGEALRLHTDSRTLIPGDCFVALRGDQFDGHGYVKGAAEAGAVGAVVSRIPEEKLPEGFGLILVDDPLLALQRYSADYRKRLGLCTVGVTGSSGKTSTKEMIASVLSQRYRTQATEGNLNNHIGVPMTLLNFRPETEYGVVEMGMNHPGEIAPLAEMSAPRIGVITMIGHAHVENFSDVHGIAEEKSELLRALPADGVAVLNAEDPFCSYLCTRTQAQIVLVGNSDAAEWRAERVALSESGISFDLVHHDRRAPVSLPFWNRKMVCNALLAAGVGGAAGLTLEEIAKGLGAVSLPGHRMKVIHAGNRLIINDAYNANPESMIAALETLQEIPGVGARLAILGSMGELGERAEALHQDVGEDAAHRKLDGVIFVGPQSKFYLAGWKKAGGSMDVAFTVESSEAALESLKSLPDAGLLLVKGSRFMKLERVVEYLTGNAGGGH